MAKMGCCPFSDSLIMVNASTLECGNAGGGCIGDMLRSVKLKLYSQPEKLLAFAVQLQKVKALTNISNNCDLTVVLLQFSEQGCYLTVLNEKLHPIHATPSRIRDDRLYAIPSPAHHDINLRHPVSGG